MNEHLNHHENMINTLEESLVDPVIKQAFTAARALEREINTEFLSEKEIAIRTAQLDREVWANYDESAMQVSGLFRRTYLNNASQAHFGPPEYRDEEMESRGFYYIPTPITDDDGEVVVMQYTAGLYFVDKKKHYCTAALNEVCVTPPPSSQMSEQRLRRYHPDIVDEIDRLTDGHADEEEFVLHRLSYVTLDNFVHDKLTSQYIDDIERYFNSKVQFDQELPYVFEMKGECTRILEGKTEVPFYLEQNSALVRPNGICIRPESDGGRLFIFELDLTQHARKFNEPNVQFRVPVKNITHFRSIRRQFAEDASNSSHDDQNLLK